MGALDIANKWNAVVADMPLKNHIERDAKKGMLGFFPPPTDLFGVTIKPSFSLALFTRFCERE